LNPANGSIRFLDQRLDKIPANKIIEHGVVHVPEGRRLFPEMTVRENLIMGSLGSEAKRKRDETMEWVFGLFPRLREREKQMAGTLSGGEQQMVAVGRGLMAKRINQEGVTVLVTEQNTKQTLEISNRGYVLENGRVVLSGSGQELLENEHVKEAYLGI
jgi:branched-chain amino acid transport system ATP-binding protein